MGEEAFQQLQSVAHFSHPSLLPCPSHPTLLSSAHTKRAHKGHIQQSCNTPIIHYCSQTGLQELDSGYFCSFPCPTYTPFPSRSRLADHYTHPTHAAFQQAERRKHKAVAKLLHRKTREKRCPRSLAKTHDKGLKNPSLTKQLSLPAFPLSLACQARVLLR